MKKIFILIMVLLMLCACAQEDQIVYEPVTIEQEENLIQNDEGKNKENDIIESNKSETEKTDSDSETSQNIENNENQNENKDKDKDKDTSQDRGNNTNQSGNSGENKEIEQNPPKTPEGTSTLTEKLIPDGTEPYVTLFNNASKTSAVNYAVADEILDLLTYENIERIDDPEEAGTSSPSFGKALTTVDTIEFINKDDGKKYTLSLYEKGFVLSGSAVTKFNGAKITVEENTWEYFVNKINTEFENAEYVIPYWFGLVSPKRVKEVVVFGENGEKYSYTQKDDAFDNFFSIFKSDIKVSSLEERFNGNKITENISGDYIRIKVYFETGTVYEILAERDYITLVSSDMKYGLRYILEGKADAYDAFLDYAEGGPINAVTG